MEDLENFKNWWLNNRVINSPKHGSLTLYHNRISGVVLYRQNEYQVELFIPQENCEVKQHIHPDVDSFEVYLCGEMVFNLDGTDYAQSTIGDTLPVPSTCYHGGATGEEGAAFLSIQKWKNGVLPTSVGENWGDKDGKDKWEKYKDEDSS